MTFSETSLSGFSRAAALLQRYFDQSLTLGEAQELKRYWEANPEFRLFAERNREIHRSLAFFSVLEDFSISGILEDGSPVRFKAPAPLFSCDREAFVIDESAFQNMARMERDAPSLPVEQGSRSPSHFMSGRKWRIFADKSARRLLLTTMILLSFGILVGLWNEFRNHRRAEPRGQVVAHLMESEKAVWENPAEAPNKGDAVRSGTLKLLDGLIAVKLIDGAEIVLEGPAEIELKTASELKLSSGYLSAEVPPQPQPLLIKAGNMNVKVLGTAFWIRADENRSEIHLLRGNVELSNPSFGSLKLDPNEAFFIWHNGMSKRYSSFDRLFLARSQFPERSAVLGQNRLRQWKDAAGSLNDRKDLLLRLDFEELEDDRLPNLSETGKERIGWAEIVDARPIEGRWSQKRALRCDGKNAHLHFDLPGPLSSFTIFVSVRIDSLDNDFNGILMSDERNTTAGLGLVHWQFTRDGSLRFGVSAPGSRALVSCLSPKLFGQRNLGQWMRLAVTIDSTTGRVQQYVNGRSVCDESIPIDFKPEIGSVSLGFRREENKDKPSRGLHGAFDELMIFNRVLSDREIKKLSE